MLRVNKVIDVKNSLSWKRLRNQRICEEPTALSSATGWQFHLSDITLTLQVPRDFLRSWRPFWWTSSAQRTWNRIIAILRCMQKHVQFHYAEIHRWIVSTVWSGFILDSLWAFIIKSRTYVRHIYGERLCPCIKNQKPNNPQSFGQWNLIIPSSEHPPSHKWHVGFHLKPKESFLLSQSSVNTRECRGIWPDLASHFALWKISSNRLKRIRNL